MNKILFMYAIICIVIIIIGISKLTGYGMKEEEFDKIKNDKKFMFLNGALIVLGFFGLGIISYQFIIRAQEPALRTWSPKTNSTISGEQYQKAPKVPANYWDI